MKDMRKAVRIWILLALLCVTGLVRLIDLAEVAVRDTYPWMATGFFIDVVDSRLTVQQVSETNFDGEPNLFHEAGLRAGDSILEIVDSSGQRRRINGYNDYGDAMRGVSRDAPWTMIVSRKADNQRPRQQRLDFPASGGFGVRTWLAFWGYALLAPLITVGTGFLIGFRRPRDNNAFTACLLLVTFSAYFYINHLAFPPPFRSLGSVYQTLLSTFFPYLFMRFFLLFPSPSWIDRWLPSLKHIGLAATCGIFAIQLHINWVVGQNFANLLNLQSMLTLLRPLGSFPSLMFLIGVVSLVSNTLASRTKADRKRMRVLLTGTIVGISPLILLLIWIRIFGTFAWEVFFLAVTVLTVFPLSFAYAVIRHRVLGIQLILRRGLRYALVSRGFLVLEWLLIYLFFKFAATPVLETFIPKMSTFGTAIGATVVLLGVWAVNRRVQPLIDRRFFREAYNAEQILRELSRNVRGLAADPDRLLKTVIDRISDSLHSDQVAIFLRGAEVRQTDSGKRELRFDAKSPEGYRCFWRRVKSAATPDGQPAPQAFSVEEGGRTLSLPANAFIPRYLKRFIQEEPEPLDVFLEDPRSWANALVRSSPQDFDPANPEGGPARPFDERKLLESLRTRLIVPLVAKDAVLGFISLGEKLSEEAYSKEDKELLQTVAEQTGIALEYAYLIKQVADQERLKRDLEIAKEVQVNLLPQALPQCSTLQYQGICYAAREVGGDYYDFLSIGEGRLYLALGDISGKGISAALLMASLQALLRSQVDRNAANVMALMTDINRLMCSSTTSSKYATFFCGLYNDNERTLTYVNAGHNPPMLFRPDDPRTSGMGAGSSEALVLDQGQAIRLQTGGMVIGLFPEATYQQETIQLVPGDVLVVFSDGVSEARDEDGEEFGEERLELLIRDNIELPAAELCDLVMANIREYAGRAEQHDDQTVVIAKSVV